MTEALDLSAFVQRLEEGGCRIEFAVEGVKDAAAIHAIEHALRPLPGLTRARVNFSEQRLLVEWTDGLEPALIVERVRALGHRIYPFSPRLREEDFEAAQARWLLRCLAVAAFAAMNIMLLSISVWAGNVSDITPETRDFFHWVSALVVLPAAAFAGQPFFRSAIRALSRRSLNMDVPISLGVLLALAISVFETLRHAEHAYFDSAIMLLVFLLAGRYLDQAMRRKTRSYAANLSALRAPTASRIDADGTVALVPAAALRPGEIVLLRPGERAPVDGIIVEGRSEIDQSLVTGETAPVAVGAGHEVYAGSLNFGGALSIRVKTAGAGTFLDEIERLLDGAIQQKSAYVRLADRAARLYAPVVHSMAALTVIFWLVAGASVHDAIIAAIAVLIITCPCALALAVPAVQVVAAGALFRAKIILSAGDAIERFADVDMVVFDKTGTLTLPELGVEADDDAPSGLVERAARLALASHHPLAVALARLSREQTPVADAQELLGSGVRAMIDGAEARLGSPGFCGLEAEAARLRETHPGASLIAFRHGGQATIFRIRQKLRADAASVVAALRRRGLEIVILSGDAAPAVRSCAQALGVADWRADMRPGEKLAFLAELKKNGRKPLMVGDGMNDAPALAAAHASLSPITASGLAQAAADALFLGDLLAPVDAALDISRRAKSLMRQNLAFAVIYNMVAVPLAVAGLATPLIAAAAMSGSSIVVTLNSLRARGAARPVSPGAASAAARGASRLNEARP
ncbi:copper-translocating P-type ATPase [Methylocella silvestris BL2]|uniref:Copper-translocating P-type ATPase n=1 Tax=Methylocella silvestris (strain DSM 15510 / CIP 108128 / LMG 27833 / NCIMB 13906 / BL2) TaxID=395965 RepID=B8EJ58_METSB|nr:copper-translocating P-type ATPase [Methylocella silvestris]ACK52550.1 copper-translocating P-type ATPase [Methylocella silvestris BL2]